MSRLTLTMVVSMVFFALLFTLWPQLDLATSAAFFSDGHFNGEKSALVMALYGGIPVMSKAIIISLFLALFFFCFVRSEKGRRRRAQVGYLLVALALGPGLLIDVVLKDNWGRARPAKVSEFGGQSRFTPAMVPSRECDNNCSFVSGHASAGFYIVSLGFLGGALALRRWTLIGLVAGGLFGLARVSQGGHFLSDVVFSFYATWFAAWFSWLLFRWLGWLPAEGHKEEAAA